MIYQTKLTNLLCIEKLKHSSVKSMRWCSSIDLKTMYHRKGYFLICSLALKRKGGTKASFTILETINHILERGSKFFSCFLYVRKAFDTVWTEGLLYKLFSEFGIGGRMWLVIKGLYTAREGMCFILWLVVQRV